MDIRIQCLMPSDYNKFKKGKIISFGKESFVVKFDDDTYQEYLKKFLGKEIEIIED